MLFTTSWDDGYALDLRTAALLEKYGCTGTFYIAPQKQHGQDLLSKEDMYSLSKKHEIGAHTLHHQRLTTLPVHEAKQEIEDSKKWVEQRTKKECTMFCYPYGDWNNEIASLVQDAGFTGARTTETLQFTTQHPFSMPTTLQVSPFPKRKVFSRWWHPLDPYGPLRVRRKQLKKLGIKKADRKDWLSLATTLFDLALTHPTPNTLPPTPIFHLWGHSYEIEKYNMWEDLELFLQHVQNSNVECVPNSVAL